ncbi:uncharacterized protein LOC132039092 [Lycium ferocissimum]|uniref:uncharacterized protein LOC132039092 n=1 Tax=Lycium ferocissimum TaxID=112874 RepID=UPI0028165A4C|nr:uncharacterized protein LOC132039092 [Lycium ferocissimum]
MEGLNYMIRKAKTNGWIKGFGTQTNRGEDMEITQLLYADDCLVFCEAKVEQIRHLRAILTIFEAISGLHVNWSKSFLYPVNQVTDLQFLASAYHKTQEIWNDVLERCEKKLTRWKSQYLSLGGRLTLINSVLDALPTYLMSLLPIPKDIEKKINKVRREFLWHENKDKKGYNLVEWQIVTLSKQHGGMGIKDLRLHNQSLLQKWLWRFCKEDRSLWRKDIAQKYGLLNQWTTNEVNTTYGCSVWKTIRRMWNECRENLSIMVGDGTNTFLLGRSLDWAL